MSSIERWQRESSWGRYERERQEIEYEECLEAARRWAARQPRVFAHNAVRELDALASIEAEAQRARAEWQATDTGPASLERFLARLAEPLGFLLGS